VSGVGRAFFDDGGNTRKLPVFRSLVPYGRTWLRSDLIAGLTVWAVLVPDLLTPLLGRPVCRDLATRIAADMGLLAFSHSSGVSVNRNSGLRLS